MSRALWMVVLGCAAACHSRSTSSGDAAAARSVVVHMPSALRVARAIDSLSVEIDPASRADVEMNVDPNMTLAAETESHVFVAGESVSKASERIGRASGGDVDVGIATWNTAQDGVPQLDKKYVVEMKIVLLESDVSGHSKTLLTRTLRQAEE